MRDVVRSVVKPVARRAVRAEYAFRMTFSPGAIPTGLVTSIAGTRYDYLTEADEIAGIETAFPANVPTITWRGLRGATAYTNYFLNSKTPVTRTITLAAAGTYSAYIYGTGTATITGASTGNGVCTGTGAGTKSNVVTFTTASAGMTITVTIAGSVNRCQVNTGATVMPFIPTAGTAVASPRETTSTSFRFYFLGFPSAKTALNSHSFEIDLEWNKTVMDIGQAQYLIGGASYYKNDYLYILDNTTAKYVIVPGTENNRFRLIVGTPPPAILEKYGAAPGEYSQIIANDTVGVLNPFNHPLKLASQEYLSILAADLSPNLCTYLKSIKILKTPKSWV